MKVDLNPLVGKVIRFKPGIEEIEAYAEPGMMARVASFKVRDPGTEDEHYQVIFDYTEFDEQNKAHETANYWNRDCTEANLTAREAGFYNEVDDLYLDAQMIRDCIELADDRTVVLHEEFRRDREGEQSYVEWLEQQLLVMREA